MTPSPEDVISILLVEPDPENADLYVDSFADVPTPAEIHTVPDGATALEFVHRRGEYADSPRPDLVLLPFRLPAISGEAVLSELKGEPALKSIPVLVLTAPDDEEIRRSYELHANAVLEKPDSSEGVDSLVRLIERFWLEFVRYPKANA
ncbi:Response regulator receiver domain-containing protein [Natronorubrum texcoconense]|uniref:Response regulator receiver domain-containing protein n=2 Tax=Natronorubrum texcoconense TaxID=1095776 RepID=A0A1G9F1B9_9EURY|nr:Response regulator receiver domain-containing protein [Natronorubrum texcoconense]